MTYSKEECELITQKESSICKNLNIFKIWDWRNRTSRVLHQIDSIQQPILYFCPVPYLYDR